MRKSELSVSLPTQDGQSTFKLSRGGARGGAGRKSKGITKKVSITLEQEDWDFIDQCIEHGSDNGMISRSAFFRYLYLYAYEPNSSKMREFSFKPVTAAKAKAAAAPISEEEAERMKRKQKDYEEMSSYGDMD